jgi:hypothetical protein
MSALVPPAAPQAIVDVVDVPRSRGSDAALILGLLGAVRTLHDDLAVAEAQGAASREALHVAVALMAERDQALKRARSTAQALREEIRRYTAAQCTQAGPRAA